VLKGNEGVVLVTGFVAVARADQRGDPSSTLPDGGIDGSGAVPGYTRVYLPALSIDLATGYWPFALLLLT